MPSQHVEHLLQGDLYRLRIQEKAHVTAVSDARDGGGQSGHGRSAWSGEVNWTQAEGVCSSSPLPSL